MLGYGNADAARLSDLRCTPRRVAIGDGVSLDFTLVAVEDMAVVVDYVVHYQGANGPRAGKVFKLTTRELLAGQPVQITRRHRFVTSPSGRSVPVRIASRCR